FRHLVLDLRRDAAHGLTLLERGDLPAFLLLVLRLPLMVRLEPVDGTPPGLERDLAARTEALLLDDRYHRRPRVARRWMEDREETSRDEIEDAALVRRQRRDVVVDVRRDDRVVVVDLRVVDHPLQRQLVERENVFGS